MDALNWEIYTYSLPYIHGGSREGIVYRLLFPDGKESWREASPLPGRSQETPADALRQLHALLSRGALPEMPAPSVQFSLDSPILPPAAGAVCAFLKGTENEILAQADRYTKLGFTDAKVKIASLPKESAGFVLNSLKDRFRLRVDCNFAYSFDEAVELFSPFSENDFAFIEDPTRERLEEFSWPFALDDAHFGAYPKLTTLVIKPTLRGGKVGCFPLMNEAKNRGLAIYLSSAMESGIGLLQILSLHSALQLEGPLGIGTMNQFDGDLIDFDFEKPQLALETMPPIRMQLLKEYAHGTFSSC